MELPNLEEIGQAMPEILQVSLYPRWRLRRHLESSTKVETHPKHIYSDNAWTCQIWKKSVKQCQRYYRFQQIQDGGCAAILDQVLRLKLIRSISITKVHKPAKLGRNCSSSARDIKGFIKTKMAAAPPF